VVNLNRSLEALKQEGYRIIGLAEEGSVTLEEANLEGPLVVVTGSESDGLSLLTRRNCDQLVRIPLRGATPSLNASVATALLLYEIARRGWMGGLQGNAPAPRLVRPAMASTPLLGLDEEPEAHDSDAEPVDSLEASEDLPLADNGPEGLETLPSEPLEIPAQLPTPPQVVPAFSTAEPDPEVAATPEPDSVAEPWQATSAQGQALPAQALDLGQEGDGGAAGNWGAVSTPSPFDNDIRL
jgi:23S rRNA (guanosine2251-2'-O)-methyltransferase